MVPVGPLANPKLGGNIMQKILGQAGGVRLRMQIVQATRQKCASGLWAAAPTAWLAGAATL